MHADILHLAERISLYSHRGQNIQMLVRYSTVSPFTQLILSRGRLYSYIAAAHLPVMRFLPFLKARKKERK
jgi:hypothetical protein